MPIKGKPFVNKVYTSIYMFSLFKKIVWCKKRKEKGTDKPRVGLVYL